MKLILPDIIANFISHAPLQADDIGESPCSVYAFTRGNDRFFLKISLAAFAPTTYSVKREADILRWLADHLSVPEVVVSTATPHGAFMITRAAPGEPLFTRIDAGQPVDGLFLEALRLVQAVPADGCPFDAGISTRLTELDYLLEQGLAAEDIDLSPWPGLNGAEDLRAHLHATRPVEDPVFSHGDLGDSNILIDSRDTLHFIDLGRGGRADRWLDIAFLCRNLREEVSADAETAFLHQLDRPDAPEKRRFFEQLDELF